MATTNMKPNLEMDVIVYGEALPKKKNEHGHDIVVLPVRHDETKIIPYYLQVTVNTPTDPTFPAYRTIVSIDGHTETTGTYHAFGHDGVLKRINIDHEYLAFGPIQSRSLVSSYDAARSGLGTITVEVTSLKVTKSTKHKEIGWRSTIGGHSLEKDINEFKLQGTKWETVSRGPLKVGTDFLEIDAFEWGPFCQTITLQYMDWDTMEHNRRLMQSDIMNRKEFEKMKSQVMKTKPVKKVMKTKAMKMKTVKSVAMQSTPSVQASSNFQPMPVVQSEPTVQQTTDVQPAPIVQPTPSEQPTPDDVQPETKLKPEPKIIVT